MTTVLSRVLAAGCLILVTACGNPGTVQSPDGSFLATATLNPATFPPLRSPQVLVGSQRLTEVNNLDTVKLAVGQRIDVSLDDYDPIEETGAALSVTAHSGGYPSRRPATGAYVAIAPGTATLVTVSDIACLHAKPHCGVPVTEWQVTVEVSAASG